MNGLGEAVGGVYHVLFGVIATRRGPHWQLAEGEALALGQSTANMLKYLPVPTEQAGIIVDSVGLAVTASLIIGRRLMRDGELRQERAQQQVAARYPQRPASQPVWTNGIGQNHASETAAELDLSTLGSP